MPARLIGHFRGKARRTLGEGQFDFTVLAGAGRKRKGGFWMSGSRSRQSLSADARSLPTHSGHFPVRVLAYNATWPTVSGSEAIAEHRQSAARFSLGRFVLKGVPVLGGLAVLDADDVSGNPGRGAAVAGEATVGDDEIALGHDQLVFVAQPCRRRSRWVRNRRAKVSLCWSVTSASGCELSEGCPFSRPGRSHRPQRARHR